MIEVIRHQRAIATRSIRSIVRQPSALFPSFGFPLIFLAITSSAMESSTRLPGFPAVDSFLQFAATTTVFQGALFGAISSGADMARDIQDGFFERLLSSPVSRVTILTGRLVGAMALAIVQALVFLTLLSVFGLDVRGGPAAFASIALVNALVAGGIGAFAIGLGLRTGSSEAVQGSFPMFFSLIFLSSAFFPRELMDGWFKIVATINPFSHLIEGLRSQVIGPFDVRALAGSIAVGLALLTAGTVVASLQLRRRLAARG